MILSDRSNGGGSVTVDAWRPVVAQGGSWSFFCRLEERPIPKVDKKEEAWWMTQPVDGRRHQVRRFDFLRAFARLVVRQQMQAFDDGWPTRKGSPNKGPVESTYKEARSRPLLRHPIGPDKAF